MICFLRKIVKKVRQIVQRGIGLLKRVVRSLLAFVLRRVSNYPFLARMAIKILNKFPHLKAIIRRVSNSRNSAQADVDLPLTQFATQIEADLQRAIAQRQGQ